jgi:hypothetical protein
VSFKHEQEFLVATQQSKAQWQEEIRQQIMLQTGDQVNMATFNPDGYWVDANNRRCMQEIYEYYANCHHKSDDVLRWAGLAKLAGGGVYAGCVDADPVGASPAGVASLELLRLLMNGARDVFNDIAWQHRAYRGSKYWGIKWVSENDPSRSHNQPVTDLPIWKDFYTGEVTTNNGALNFASTRLLRREQEHVLANTFLAIHRLGAALGSEPGPYAVIMSDQAKSSIPPGTPTFRDTVPLQRPPSVPESEPWKPWITEFDARWTWVGDNGMVGTWGVLSNGTRLGYSATPLLDLARMHSISPGAVQ